MPNFVEKTYWTAFALAHMRGQRHFAFLPPEKIARLQARRVRSIVSHAYQTVPFYRDAMRKARLRPRDFRTAGDLALLPLVSKEEFIADPERFLSERYRRGATKVCSSGTGGRIKPVHYDDAALFIFRAHRLRHRTAIERIVGGLPARQMSAVLKGGAIMTLSQFYRSHSWMPAGPENRPAHLSLEVPFDEVVEHLNHFQPEILHGLGSWLGAVFRQAHERGVALCKPKLINYFADRLADSDRLFLENELGIAVTSAYGATEALQIGFECEMRSGFHMHIDDVAFRIVNTGNPHPSRPSTGEIVISNLLNRATVLLNYLPGDTVTTRDEACPCGRSLPMLARIDGRADDLIVLPDGTVVHGLVLAHDFHEIRGLVRTQIIQEDGLRVTILAVCKSSADWTAVAAAIGNKVRAILGADIVLKLERVDEIPRGPGGKVRSVVSHLAQQF